MTITEIKISELNPLTNISSSDFFPIVHSASLTTLRTDITSLNRWMSASGSALSSSYSPSAYWQLASNSPLNINNSNVGNVGVNTTSPAYTLDVNGKTNSTNLQVGHVITASIITCSLSLHSNTLGIPYKPFNYFTTQQNQSSIYFNAGPYDDDAFTHTLYGYGTDWATIFYTDATGHCGQLNVSIGDDGITASTTNTGPGGNYTLAGPNIEYLKSTSKGFVISTWGTSTPAPPIISLQTSSAFFVDVINGWTYGKFFMGDRFVGHDYNTGFEGTYGSSSVAISYTATTGSPAVGFIGTSSYAISASCAATASYFSNLSTVRTVYSSSFSYWTPGAPVVIPHSLGVTPSYVRWVFVVTSPTAQGLQIGDEIDVGCASQNPPEQHPQLTTLANSTSLRFCSGTWSNYPQIISVYNTGSWDSSISASLKLKVYYSI